MLQEDFMLDLGLLVSYIEHNRGDSSRRKEAHMTVNEEDFTPPDHDYSCDACGSTSVSYVLSKKSGLPALACLDCRAYVSCHRETYEKMGYMAHPQIRAMRRKLHYIADPLWMNGLITREYLYVLLSHAISKERPLS